LELQLVVVGVRHFLASGQQYSVDLHTAPAGVGAGPGGAGVGAGPGVHDFCVQVVLTALLMLLDQKGIAMWS
jgi:hypothetical protein